MKAKPHYHNAVGTVGYLLEEYEAKAKKQDQIIFDMMRNYDLSMSPSQIYKIFQERIPLTSIRRALSNLTRDGYLHKLTYNKITGIYGRVECTWCVRGEHRNG
jgi:Fe2+ or Zn2+ uptake regulation protein